MSKKYNAVHVKTHQAFQNLLKHKPAPLFCPEPMHPYQIGHLVIAEEVYKALGD